MDTVLRVLRCLVWLGCGAGFSGLAAAYGTVSSGSQTLPRWVTNGYESSSSTGSCAAFIADNFGSTDFRIVPREPAETSDGYPVYSCNRRDGEVGGEPNYGGNYTTRVEGTIVQAGCPSNSTGTSTCTCSDGYRPNSGGTACESYGCNFGAKLSTDTSTKYTINGSSACFGGCTAVPSSAFGTGDNRWAVGPWYAVGGTCTGEANGGASPPVDTEASTCPAKQCPGTVNGEAVCVPCGTETTNEVTKSTDTPASGPGSTTGTIKETTTNPDGTTTTKTTTTTTGGTSGGGTSESTTEAPEKGKCELNSSDAGCGGTPGPNTGLYTKGTKTFDQVLTNFYSQANATGVGLAIGGFFNVGELGGGCPTYTMDLEYFDSTVTIDFLCSEMMAMVLLAAKAVVLLLAAVSAFRIAVE